MGGLWCWGKEAKTLGGSHVQAKSSISCIAGRLNHTKTTDQDDPRPHNPGQRDTALQMEAKAALPAVGTNVELRVEPSEGPGESMEKRD